MAFFTDKDEAKDFAKNIEDAMKKHGFKVLCDVSKEKTADGKELYGVSGKLYDSGARINVLVNHDEVIMEFMSKKNAEREVYVFYKDLKNASQIFEIYAGLE